MSEILWLSFGLAVVCMLPFVLDRERSLLAALYVTTVGFFVQYPLHSLYAYFFGSYMIDPSDVSLRTQHAWILALVYSILAFLAMYLCYRSKLGVALARSLPPLGKAWNLPGSSRAALVCAAIGIGSHALLVWHFGGLAWYLQHPYETRTAWGVETFKIFTPFLMYACLIAYVNVLYLRRLRLLMVLLFGLTVAVAVSTNARGFVLALLLAMIVIRYYVRKYHMVKSPRIAVRLALLVALALVLIPTFGAYRSTADLGETMKALGTFTISGMLQKPLRRMYGMDAFTIIVRDVPAVLDFRYGGTIWPIAFAWIPRAIWSEKPVISPGRQLADTLFAEWFGGGELFVGVSLLGDAYLNFHVAGVVVLAGTIGVVIRMLWAYCRPNRSIPGTFLYATVVSTLALMWEASFIGLIFSSVPNLLFAAYIAHYLARAPARPRAEVAGAASGQALVS